MTSIIVSHEIADVDVVLLRFRGNGAPFAVPLSARQAKRLAWGILADLDPEEAAEAIRLAQLPPSPVKLVLAALDHLEARKGTDAALKVVNDWRRSRRSTKRPSNVVHIHNDVALFKGDR